MRTKSERLKLCDQLAQELLDDARRRGLRATKITRYDSPNYVVVRVYLPRVNLKGYTFDQMVLYVVYTRTDIPDINIFVKDMRQSKRFRGGREPEHIPGAKYSRHPHAGGGGNLCSPKWSARAIDGWAAGRGVDQLIPGAINVVATHTPRDVLYDLGGIGHCAMCRSWLGDDPLYYRFGSELCCHCGDCQAGEPICSECAYVCKVCEEIVSKQCRRYHTVLCGVGPDTQLEEDDFRDQFVSYATWKQKKKEKELS